MAPSYLVLANTVKSFLSLLKRRYGARHFVLIGFVACMLIKAHATSPAVPNAACASDQIAHSEVIEICGDSIDNDCDAEIDEPDCFLAITACGFAIDQPGQYALTSDLVHNGPFTCIIIQSSDVTLDGQGHIILGSSARPLLGINAWKPGEVISRVVIRDIGMADIDFGILLANIEDSLIDNAKIAHTGEGLFLEEVHRTTIRNNVIIKSIANASTSAGIILSDSESNDILSNDIRNFPESGVLLFALSSNNRFANNRVCGGTADFGCGIVADNNIDLGGNIFDTSSCGWAVPSGACDGLGRATGVVECGIVIDRPGNYVLLNDLITPSRTTCITITSPNVTLDGQQYTIRGQGADSQTLDTQGIFIGNNLRDVAHVVVQNVRLHDLSWGVTLGETVHDSRIANLIAERVGQAVILSGQNNLLTGCTIDNSTIGIMLVHGQSQSITDATVSSSGSGSGIWIEDGSDHSITDTTMTSGGIFAKDAHGLAIDRVRFLDHSGISFENVHQSTIANIIGTNGGFIDIDAGAENCIMNNTLGSAVVGLNLSGVSNSVIMSNTVTENGFGIGLDNSENNAFSSNVVCRNGEDFACSSLSRNNTDLGDNVFDNSRCSWLTRSTSCNEHEQFIAITDCGVVIDQPGEYTLLNDLTTSDVCITIATHDVFLDGNGKTIDGFGEGIGVLVSAQASRLFNVAIANLTIENLGTGILGSSVSSLSIFDTRIHGMTNRGLDLREVNDSFIEGNALDVNREGIVLADGRRNLFAENRITRSSGTGMILGNAQEAMLINNMILESERNGLRLSRSNRNTLASNTICGSELGADLVCDVDSAFNMNDGGNVFDRSSCSWVQAAEPCLSTTGKPVQLVSIMHGLGLSPDRFISPLGDHLSFNEIAVELSEPAYLIAGNVQLLGIGNQSLLPAALRFPLPRVADFVDEGQGAHSILLSSRIPLHDWIKITLVVASTETHVLATFDLFIAHLPGDVNQDSHVSIRDATAFGDEFSGRKAAELIDLNGDGEVAVRDATAFGDLWHGRAGHFAWKGKALPVLVDDCGVAISDPGSYVLAQDLHVPSESVCIRIQASDVTLDGQGFTIGGSGDQSESGVLAFNGFLTDPLENVRIANLAFENLNSGVLLMNARDSSIVGVSASNNGRGLGIGLRSVSDTLLRENVVNATETGILFSDSHDLEIQRNTISNATRDGLRLDGVGSSAFVGNAIFESGANGVALSMSTGNEFEANTICVSVPSKASCTAG